VSMEAGVGSELTVFLDYIQHKIQENDGILYMKHVFTLPVLNILWDMVAGIRFSYEDHKLKELVQIVEELSRSFDIGGNILMGFPSLRFVAPEITGHSQHMRLYGRLHEYFRVFDSDNAN